MNRMILLARLDIASHRLNFFRWIIRAVLFVLLLGALLNQQSSVPTLLFGLFFIILPTGILLDLFQLFVRSEVGLEEQRQAENCTGTSFEVAALFVRSHNRSQNLLYNLVNDRSVRFLLVRFGVAPKQYYELAKSVPDYDSWVSSAALLAKTAQEPLKPKHLFEAIQSLPEYDAFWQSLGVTQQTRTQVWAWSDRIGDSIKESQRGLGKALHYSGGIGRDWTSGYTKALDAFASDVTKQLQQANQHIHLTGHTDEKKRILEYMGRDDRHNLVIIGEEGIGKQRIIYNLASNFNRGDVPESLRYKHIYQLDVGSLMSGGDQSQLEARLSAVLQEASTVGNVILVVPDFHLLVGAASGKTVGIVNASGLLSPYLQGTGLQIVALMEPDAYYTYVKPNVALEPFLATVEIKEIDAADALRILQDEVLRYEAKYKRLFTYQSLEKIIQIAEQHVHDAPYPEKALALLSEVASGSAQESNPIVYAKDVERLLADKLKLPLGQLSTTEKDTLANLEALIRTRLIGQSEAVKTVADALRRARSGITSGKRPIGSFLFLGPTGVGKTEMAKTIAELYYKSAKAFIRLDMSEYQTPESLEKLVGTRETPGLLTTAVTDQPFSVILLDEIEKAHQSVRNLFLQVLDDGHVTNGYGKRVSFANSMVIATSNAGAQMIRDAVGSNTIDTTFKARLLDNIQDQGVFSPEWINRFDAVVVFLPLTRDEIREVAKLQVAALTKRMTQHNIELTVADDVYDLLVERGYDPEYGARPMRRAVQDILESALAKVLLNDTTEGVKKITLTRDMLQ